MIKKGISNLEVKNYNKKRIINLLYQKNEVTRQDISRILGLSLPTVTQVLKELCEIGLVKEAGTLASSGGRKPTLNAIQYDAKLSVGIEVTQNAVRLVLIDLSGKVLDHSLVQKGFENSGVYFDALGDLVDQMIHKNNVAPDTVLGIGLAIPGIISKHNGMVEFLPTLGVKNLPIQKIEEHFPYRVMIDNEANLAGLAEIWNIRHLNDAVFLSINKGVGGAIILSDMIYDGRHYRAGEFGHMTIIKDGKECSCGKRGCLEAYCSTKVLCVDEGEHLGDFFSRLKEGEGEYVRVWDEYLDNLSICINNIRMIFDVDVIIGGRIQRYIADYIEQLNQKVRKRNSFSDPAEYIHISKYGEKASAVGGALLLVNDFLNN